MRTISASSRRSTLLAGAAIVVPVVSVGARPPHAVKPSLQRVPMPAAHAAATSSTAVRAGVAAGAESGTASESVLTRDTDGADVVGVGFPDPCPPPTASPWRSAAGTARPRGDRGARVGLSYSAPDPGKRRGRSSQGCDRARGRRRVRSRSRSGCEPVRPPRPGSTGIEATFAPRRDQRGRRAPGADTRRDRQRRRQAGHRQPRPMGGRREPAQLFARPTSTKVKGAIVHHTVNTNTYTSDQAAGSRAWHLRLPRQRQRLVRHRLPVPRRPFRSPCTRAGSAGTDKNVVGAQAQGFNRQKLRRLLHRPTTTPTTAGAVAPSTAVLSAIGKADRVGRPGSTGSDPRRPPAATPRREARGGPRGPSSPCPGSWGTATST